ncbi:MAG TPA: ABC transporter permease [Casimicrobiaceae bacterium]|nr:ABC transporter permease [Casimicrobiaceae bacterium]
MTSMVNSETAHAPVNVEAGACAGSGTSMRATWARFMPPLALFVGVVVAWEAVSRIFRLPEFVLPAPTAIVEVLISNQRALAYAAFVTAREVLWGFLLSAVIGAAVALVIARFAAFGRALYPLVVLFQNVPKVALAPLFILWFGFDLAPKVVLIVVIAFFPVAINMLVGLQTVDANLIALMRSVGASRNEILLRIQVPNSLPYLMAGLKVAVTFAVIGAIVGEFAGAQAGLGYMIQFASTQMQTSLVFAALVEVSVLGMLFYYVIEWVERRYIDWMPAAA